MAGNTPTKATADLLKSLQLSTSQEVEKKFVNEATKLQPKPGKRLTRASTASAKSSQQATPSSPENSSMSSQRRAPRSGARGGAQENGEELNLWQDCTSVLAELLQKEKEAEELKQKIFAEETKLAESKRNGRGMLSFLCTLLLQAPYCADTKKNHL